MEPMVSLLILAHPIVLLRRRMDMRAGGTWRNGLAEEIEQKICSSGGCVMVLMVFCVCEGEDDGGRRGDKNDDGQK